MGRYLQINGLGFDLKLNNGTMLATVLDHIGMGMGGVFKSTDNGETWSNIGLSDKFPFSLAKNSQDEIYVGCLVLYDPDNPQRGFYKSSDYGETWEEFLPHQCVQSITVDNNDVIYVNLYCDAWGIFPMMVICMLLDNTTIKSTAAASRCMRSLK